MGLGPQVVACKSVSAVAVFLCPLFGSRTRPRHGCVRQLNIPWEFRCGGRWLEEGGGGEEGKRGGGGEGRTEHFTTAVLHKPAKATMMFAFEGRGDAKSGNRLDQNGSQTRMGVMEACQVDEGKDVPRIEQGGTSCCMLEGGQTNPRDQARPRGTGKKIGSDHGLYTWVSGPSYYALYLSFAVAHRGCHAPAYHSSAVLLPLLA